MFEYTVEGCAEAIKYIKDTKQKHLLDHKLSMDGWTIVALANSLRKKDKYIYEDQDGKHEISRQEILDTYYMYWTDKMIHVNKEHLINEDNCIEDFCTVHWTHKLKGT